MQIRRIDVKNFKRLADPITIDRLKNGINVLAGDNEEGKSTLLLALRAAFFQKYNATGQAVKAMQPYNAAVRPEVAVDFEIEGKSYSLRKIFAAKSAVAELTSPNGKCSGAEVEERIRDLFRLPDVEKSKQDSGIWGLLWLEQTAATEGLKISDGGRETLIRALDSDLGAVVGGEQGRALFKEVKSEFAKFYTASQMKETGEYKKALELRGEINEKYSSTQERFKTYEQNLDSLAQKQERLNNYEKAQSLDNAREALKNVQADIAAVDKLKLELLNCRSQEKTASLEWTNAQDELKARSSKEQQLKDSNKHLEATNAVVNKLQEDQEQLKQQMKIQECILLEKNSEYETTEKNCAAAERIASFHTLLKDKTELAKQTDDLRKWQAKLAELLEQRKRNKITELVLDKLRKLEAQKNEATIRAETAATKLVARPLANNRALIGAEEIQANSEITLSQRTTISLENWGELDLTPGGEKTAQYKEAARAKQREFENELAAAGAASMEEANTLAERLRQANVEIDEANKEIKRIDAGAAGVEGLQARIIQFDQQLDAFSDLRDSTAGQTTANSLTTLREYRDAARKDAAKERQQYEGAQKTHSDAERNLLNIEKERSMYEESCKKLTQELEAPFVKSLGQLEEAENHREAQALSAQNSTKLKERALADLKGDELQGLETLRRRDLQELENTINKLKDEIKEIRGYITAVGQTGLDEELKKLEGEKQRVDQDCERLQRRALALKLLFETLSQAEQEAKAQFLEPMLEILRPHLSDLFPGAQLILDPKMIEISQLERSGYKEQYNDLSAGTREQISVLTRLAIAQLLKKRGQPSVLVLDDTLVYSDDTRINKMKQLLKEVSKEIQILILTCRLRDYSDMPGINIIELAKCKNTSGVTIHS